MSERKLASIQTIAKLEPIEGADAIERATILGWQCVVKKNEFKVGDQVVYCEVDSLLPIKPEFEFLRKSCFNPRLNGFRIRTIKLRGQISQGIAFPISICSTLDPVGTDVTDVLGIRKYEPEIHSSLKGEVKGNFPSFIPKTDEERIQNVPDVLTRYPGEYFVATEKVDGTSATFYMKDKELGVCGRNYEYKSTVENTYWAVAKKYDLETKLRLVPYNVAVQGEIVGPGIQKNKYALSEFKFYLFSVFDVDIYRYLDHGSLVKFAQTYGFEVVPEVARLQLDSISTIEKAIAFSQDKSALNKNIQREGVVIKSLYEKTDPQLGRLSFKIINPNFLLKYEE